MILVIGAACPLLKLACKNLTTQEKTLIAKVVIEEHIIPRGNFHFVTSFKVGRSRGYQKRGGQDGLVVENNWKQKLTAVCQQTDFCRSRKFVVN